MALHLDVICMRDWRAPPLLTANPANFAKPPHCYKLAELAAIAVSKLGKPRKRGLLEGAATAMVNGSRVPARPAGSTVAATACRAGRVAEGRQPGATRPMGTLP